MLRRMADLEFVDRGRPKNSDRKVKQERKAPAPVYSAPEADRHRAGQMGTLRPSIQPWLLLGETAQAASALSAESCGRGYSRNRGLEDEDMNVDFIRFATFPWNARSRRQRLLAAVMAQ